MTHNQLKEPGLADEATRRRKLTAWTTVGATFLVLFLTGHFQYSFGVFVKPMIDMFGWSRGAIASIVSVRAVLTGILSPFGGKLMDKYGSRKLLLVGICLFGLGFFMSSRATSLWQFYLSFGLFIGLSNSIIFVPAVANVTKWFDGKSATANGIAMSGLSVAQIFFPPITAYLISGYGWEHALIIMAVGVWILAGSSWTFIRNPERSTPVQAKETDHPGNAKGDFTLAAALHTAAFWAISAVFAISAVCVQMVGVHIVVAAVDLGAEAGAAAIILAVMGVSNTLGRLTVSSLADRIGGRSVMGVSMALQAVTLFILAGITDVRSFYVTAAIFGLLYGSVMPLIPALTSSLFGTRSMGAIFGVINSAYLLGAAIGPFAGGYLFDITGSYYIAFVSGAVLAVIASFLCFAIRLPQKGITAAV